MVLDHVTQRAGIVIKASASLEPDSLADSNLHMRDSIGVPQRLKHHIGKAQRHQVLDGFLAQIMVDTEGALFGEYRVDGVINVTGGGEISAQRLFKANSDILAR